jgi:hypothetical protein
MKTMSVNPGIPHISVVMPSLNQGRFLEEAVRSVLEQSEPSLELVVADGGSSDGTLPLLARLAAAYPGRLRWLSHPDGGPAQAIAGAIARARAPILGWLNSDDLYTPGAVARALAWFSQHSAGVMVYGHGEHTDEHGQVLQRYPTLEPTVALDAFREGCFICQPTVFFRRDAYQRIGGIDLQLRAAFDFDLWVRFFKAYPGRIGFIDAVQAQSRLHEGGITLSQRERVAREGMLVVARHLGEAPIAWALTWLDELCLQHPFHAHQLDLRDRLQQLVRDSGDHFGPAAREALLQRLATDARLSLSDSRLFVDVTPDGWAAPVMEVRVLQLPQPARRLSLSCRHASPVGGPLRLRCRLPEGEVIVFEQPDNGPFTIELDLGAFAEGSRVIFRFETLEGGFVPADCEPGSRDRRSLAFRVEAARLD